MRIAALSLMVGGALGQGWQYERRNIATIALGIDCPDDRTCFMGASQDGVGNIILRTSNGGESYERMNLGEGGRPPLQMMLMTTASQAADSAVTAGMGFLNNAVYSDDGDNFDSGEDFTVIGVSQNIKIIPGVRGGYGMAGDFVDPLSGQDEHDIAISVDGGNSFRTQPLPDGVLGGWSRYAHYVDAYTWYVSGGSWPRNDNFDKKHFHSYSELFTLDKDKHSFKFNNGTDSNAREGYTAGVARTVDGGATWERVFFAQDEGFYLNEIDCPSRGVCFVTGEGRQSARIMRTTDNGANWETIWSQPSGHSLMGIHFFDEQEGWACGMRIEGFDFATLFLHTTDGGDTWEEELVGQAMCTGMSFHGRTNRNFAHATALEPLTGMSSTLVYRA